MVTLCSFCLFYFTVVTAEETMAKKDSHTVGQNIHLKATRLLGAMNTWFDEQFLWIDEVLAEAKKTMAM